MPIEVAGPEIFTLRLLVVGTRHYGVRMTANVHLAAFMEREGLKQAELADRLNLRIEALTGQMGKLQDRHVRNWLTGKTRWPQERQRLVLQAEFGATAEELGFSPPAATKQLPSEDPALREGSAPSEDPVRRRTFTTATASLTAAAILPTPCSNGSSRVGMSDANRLEVSFARLVEDDNKGGGTVKLETRALAHAQHAMDLQAVGQTTQRVRKRLYYLAAAFIGTALWAAVDANEPDRAQRHLERAMTLARMASSSEMEMRLWGHAALLSFQQHCVPDALAAAEAGRNAQVCRRDPLYRSLASARLAGIQAGAGERTNALRTLGRAETAFQRSSFPEERPTWIGFFDRAELDGLSGLVMARIGRHEEAEAYLHRTLARLRPEYRRNHTYYGAQLALAQLHQGAVEQACATATKVLSGQARTSLTGRTGKLLKTFDRDLSSVAQGARCAVDWTDRYNEGMR
ncbi:hypothetical protein OHB35_00335 [Streptomyces phaeochromogenes]|uniref:Uncharacterized protein n=1 Tax=Streptomyces phaeochromogenes TaxID=1923 RepID=A0ABZ1GZU2_STRPH|nr:hypothetical protein [Streptomyces phaeochromogenes]WSD11791.1 hypothetical protein OHB35_00335 [Streptomyces phaeochromogenes]